MTGSHQATERPVYRVFFLDDDNNDKVLGRLDLIRAGNDETAIREVRDLRYPGLCELWDGTRLVRRFNGTDQHKATSNAKAGTALWPNPMLKTKRR